MADVSDLTQIEIDVLNALSRARTTPSTVRLAAELWQPGNVFDGGDPLGLTAFVLAGLNERGLVTYRLDTKGQDIWERDMPHTIRLSFDGWEACGYPRYSPVAVGSFEAQRAHLPAHRGDPTDFRRHREEAEGGAIVKEDIWVHAATFPDHDHSFIFGDDMGEPDMTRSYTRITADMVAEIMLAKTNLGPTASYAEIADEAGYTPRQVRYVLTQAPLMRRMGKGEEEVAASLKHRIVDVLSKVGPMRNVGELRVILSYGDSDHDIVHVLHSLHKDGKVEFREGRGAGEPTDIRLRKKSNGRMLPEPEPMAAFVTDRIPTREQAVEAAPEVEVPTSATDTPTTAITLAQDAYPLLRDLMGREAQRALKDEKGLAYLKAAEALKGIDDEAARDLMAKAEENDVPFPSPIESEYLAYAKAHE